MKKYLMMCLLMLLPLAVMAQYEEESENGVVSTTTTMKVWTRPTIKTTWPIRAFLSLMLCWVSQARLSER